MKYKVLTQAFVPVGDVDAKSPEEGLEIAKETFGGSPIIDLARSEKGQMQIQRKVDRWNRWESMEYRK